MGDEPSAPEVHFPFQTDGLVLVAEDDGGLIGFATCQACADALHLWELAVRHDRQGQGVGRALLNGVFELAAARGLGAVTLTTFAALAWNAPFYERMGFRKLRELELNGRLHTIRIREAELGLDVAARCVMRR